MKTKTVALVIGIKNYGIEHLNRLGLLEGYTADEIVEAAEAATREGRPGPELLADLRELMEAA